MSAVDRCSASNQKLVSAVRPKPNSISGSPQIGQPTGGRQSEHIEPAKLSSAPRPFAKLLLRCLRKAHRLVDKERVAANGSVPITVNLWAHVGMQVHLVKTLLVPASAVQIGKHGGRRHGCECHIC
eukprot:6173488-Pleurochrysis_carterae.AAC.1